MSLDGHLLAPVLFRELQAVVPFTSCLFIWLGPGGGPVDVYFNAPEIGKFLPLYAEHYFRRLEAQVWATPAEAAVGEQGPRHWLQVLRIPKADYHRHPIYNEIMLPSNAHTFVRLAITDCGRLTGAFTIGRGKLDKDFDEDDLRALARLQPFLVHALAQRTYGLSGELVANEYALVITDATGNIQSLSPDAGRWLSLSQGSALAPAIVHAALWRSVKSLVQAGQGAASSKPPFWRACNAWGQFTARAYWLSGASSSLPLVGIHLERAVPRSIFLLDRLREFALPARQEEIALMLALGSSESLVARQLGISVNTVVYHRRQIYNRLGIDSRTMMVARLSAAAGPLEESLQKAPGSIHAP